MYGALTIKLTEQEAKALHTLLGGIEFSVAQQKIIKTFREITDETLKDVEESLVGGYSMTIDLSIKDATVLRDSLQMAIRGANLSKAELDGAIGICIGVYVKLCLEIDLAKETKWLWL